MRPAVHLHVALHQFPALIVCTETFVTYLAYLCATKLMLWTSKIIDLMLSFKLKSSLSCLSLSSVSNIANIYNNYLTGLSCAQLDSPKPRATARSYNFTDAGGGMHEDSGKLSVEYL